ncbi:hypothetical protein BpHYR1_008277 [Brachionus plicatilis]|uniref:Uncharacterized protein n=1 Tax=Brachionus plicatilis TaxID=10195 RepID=A0A3M7Q250_BRAPC|nr:hypothetical protein BpHYR1_008277 [Brachionus plicatilis]
MVHYQINIKLIFLSLKFNKKEYFKILNMKINLTLHVKRSTKSNTSRDYLKRNTKIKEIEHKSQKLMTFFEIYLSKSIGTKEIELCFDCAKIIFPFKSKLPGSTLCASPAY